MFKNGYYVNRQTSQTFQKTELQQNQQNELKLCLSKHYTGQNNTHLIQARDFA